MSVNGGCFRFSIDKYSRGVAKLPKIYIGILQVVTGRAMWSGNANDN